MSWNSYGGVKKDLNLTKQHHLLAGSYSYKNEKYPKPNALTAVTGVGSSPALATCETRHVLLSGGQVVFPGYSRFAPPTDWLVSI